MSDAKSLPDQIERVSHALTAAELAQWLAVSRITIFKLARAGRIPCFRIGTCVRFDPKSGGGVVEEPLTAGHRKPNWA